MSIVCVLNWSNWGARYPMYACSCSRLHILANQSHLIRCHVSLSTWIYISYALNVTSFLFLVIFSFVLFRRWQRSRCARSRSMRIWSRYTCRSDQRQCIYAKRAQSAGVSDTLQMCTEDIYICIWILFTYHFAQLATDECKQKKNEQKDERRLNWNNCMQNGADDEPDQAKRMWKKGIEMHHHCHWMSRTLIWMVCTCDTFRCAS